MILDEKLYDPALPEEERGKNAWDRTKPRRTSLRKRLREENVSSLEGGRRKLRRTASTKLNSQSERIWGDIVGGGIIAQVSRSRQWETNDDESTHTLESATKEFSERTNTGTLQSTVNPSPSKTGILGGCRFYLHGFTPARAQILRNHLLPHDAEAFDTIGDLQSPKQCRFSSRPYLIVPHNLPLSDHPELPHSQPQVETVTEWWVERCLHHKKFMDPTEHVIGRPFPVFPIEGFAGMTVSSAAFAGIDLLHVKKAVELLGAKYSEDMTPQSSVLLTKSLVGLRKDKFNHAQQWKIPIVNADWLWESIKAGKKLSIQKFRCRSQRRSDSLPTASEASMSKEQHHAERSTSELTKPISRSSGHSSKPTAKPTRNLYLDNTAFNDDAPVPVKEEQHSSPSLNMANASTSTTEPLSEVDPNSPTKTVSTAPAPSDHPAPRPREDISNAISNLLAKTKTASAQPGQNEPVEGRKRGANRILGRVRSNVSQASTNLSRATSVDSTATHGHPVEWPTNNNSGNTLSGQTTADQMEMIMNGDRNVDKNIDSQPPATQLQYDDPDSKEYKERVMARMLGEKLDTKRTAMKEKVVTIGDLTDRPRTRRSGRGVPGFR
jgi:DNA replication regulator DPB11